VVTSKYNKIEQIIMELVERLRAPLKSGGEAQAALTIRIEDSLKVIFKALEEYG
jgi:hypothetical protein